MRCEIMKCYWSNDECKNCIPYRKDRCEIYQLLKVNDLIGE